MMLAFFAAIGLLGGILTGMMSIGGGLIIIFLLLLVPPFFGETYSMFYIAGVAILYTIFSSGSGLIAYWRNGNVHRMTAVFMGAGSFIGGLLGSLLSRLLDDTSLTLIFALLATTAAFSMLFRPNTPASNAAMSGDRSVSALFRSLAFVSGLVLGVLGGMIGIGAGFLYVPLLLLVFKLPQMAAVGTSMVQMMALVSGAFLVKTAGADMPWLHGLVISIGAIPGAQLGALLAKRISPALLKWFMNMTIVIIMAKTWYEVLF